MKPVLVLIPAHNEKETIGGLIAKIKEAYGSFCDVLLVNDASADGTNFLGKQLGVAVVTHVFQLGYGSALQTGYKYAIRYGYETIIQLDADGQHDIENIERLYQKLQTVDAEGHKPDIVIGSRFLDGSTGFRISGIKKCAIRMFRAMIRYATGVSITDPTSGLQAISRSALLYYSQYGHFDFRYPDANMLMQMILLGYHVSEVPAVMYAREHGASMHSGLKPIFYMMTMLTSILNVFIRSRIEKWGKKKQA